MIYAYYYIAGSCRCFYYSYTDWILEEGLTVEVVIEGEVTKEFLWIQI
jgi:hypothetical protein